VVVGAVVIVAYTSYAREDKRRDSDLGRPSDDCKFAHDPSCHNDDRRTGSV
jgi:hypothetical protein